MSEHPKPAGDSSIANLIEERMEKAWWEMDQELERLANHSPLTKDQYFVTLEELARSTDHPEVLVIHPPPFGFPPPVLPDHYFTQDPLFIRREDLAEGLRLKYGRTCGQEELLQK